MILTGTLLLSCAPAFSHPADENTSLTLEDMTRQFREDRFGMFIHWGLYSVLGDGERVMDDRKIPIAEYERLARSFNPADFSAKDWVTLAKTAGMKSITFTAKHHDGFAMWDSGVSDYNVVKRTPFARDVVKELTDECHLQNVKLYLYYSLLDWHHPDYFPRGMTGKTAGRPEHGDWNKYLNFTDTQLVELLMKYDPIAGIRFDGWWDKPDADWRLDLTYRIVRALHKSALIGNNHHRNPFPGENFQIYESAQPGENKSALSATAQPGTLPLETCDTMNKSRGFRITDRDYKSTRELISTLVRAAGADAGLLLSVGPPANGRIHPEIAQRLREIGLWMARHSVTIYATRGGPVPPQPWGATTHRGNKVYVHVLDSDVKSVTLKMAGRNVRSARTFGSEEEIAFTKEEDSVSLELPALETGQMHRVIELQADETSSTAVHRGLETTYTAVAE